MHYFPQVLDYSDLPPCEGSGMEMCAHHLLNVDTTTIRRNQYSS